MPEILLFEQARAEGFLKLLLGLARQQAAGERQRPRGYGISFPRLNFATYFALLPTT
jgi:hypothetical protein